MDPMSSAGQVAVVVFDVNETLSDIEPVREVFTAAGLSGDLLDTWFASTLRDGFALAAAGTSAPFRVVGAGALRFLVAGRPDLDVERLVSDVLERFASLEVHSDVVAGLRVLAEAGRRVVTLSNGAATVAERLLERAGVAELVELRLSVDDAGFWKPHPASYGYAAQRCGV